jgi:hypothetical protein
MISNRRGKEQSKPRMAIFKENAGKPSKQSNQITAASNLPIGAGVCVLERSRCALGGGGWAGLLYELDHTLNNPAAWLAAVP